VKYFDFLDKPPEIGTLAIIEGTEQLFSDRTVALIEERLLDEATRELNSERFIGAELDSMEPVAAACAAMPFLGPTRVIVVRRAHEMRAAPRRALWQVAQAVPAGNTLVLEDLQSPAKRTKPETFGQLAGRSALRIDVTAGVDARARYVREALAELGVTAEPAAVAAIANGNVPLSSVRSDLEKLSLCGPRITLEDLLRESIVAEDVKAYQAASALVEGRADRALALTSEMIAAQGDRGAAVPLLAAVATEYRLLWEFARPGGEIPERMRWRERVLRPIARRLGERRARLGYERAVLGFEALVTGRSDDLRSVIAVLAAEAAEREENASSKEGRERPGVRTTRGR
jgi:DNA polymerase III delta subunit